MDTWFQKQKKFVQVLLLVIPFINWIMELLVRWSAWLKKGGALRLVLCLLVTIPTGVIIGWIDAICVLASNKIMCE